jgi:hypothetical protein
MNIRLFLAGLASLALAGSAAAQGPTLTDANSITIPGSLDSAQSFEGESCGGVATRSRPLPAGSENVVVTSPRVGDRDRNGATRVTAVAVAGTVMTVTVVADGPANCDPRRPTAEWRADYTFAAKFTRRVQPVMRVYFESFLAGAKWAARPKTVSDSRAGARTRDVFTGIRWQQYGGRKAVGTGKLKLDYCRRGDACPLQGKRVRLVASAPGPCKDSGRVEYLKLTVSIGSRPYMSTSITCG